MLKFASHRISLHWLRHYFDDAHFFGDFIVGLLNSMTLMIQFDVEVDLVRLLVKLSCFILSYSYQIFRWMTGADLTNGKFLTPIWITLPHLPLQFFHPDLLRPIVSSFG